MQHRNNAKQINYKGYNWPIYVWMRENEYTFQEICYVENNEATNVEKDITTLYKDTVLNIDNGSSRSIATRNKIAIGHSRSQAKVTCPYCGVIGGTQVMRRRHFENCKHK